MALVQKIKDSFLDIRFIAEDLGYPTPEVAVLLKASGFPGMKVLEFSFDSRDPGEPAALRSHDLRRARVLGAGLR